MSFHLCHHLKWHLYIVIYDIFQVGRLEISPIGGAEGWSVSPERELHEHTHAYSYRSSSGGSRWRLCKHSGVTRPPLPRTNTHAPTRTVKLLNPSTSLRRRHSLFKFIIPPPPLHPLSVFLICPPPPSPARFVPFPVIQVIPLRLCATASGICAFSKTRQRFF